MLPVKTLSRDLACERRWNVMNVPPCPRVDVLTHHTGLISWLFPHTGACTRALLGAVNKGTTWRLFVCLVVLFECQEIWSGVLLCLPLSAWHPA